MSKMAQTMADNEERRYQEKIGPAAWEMLQSIRAEFGIEAAQKAARMLDAYVERGIVPKACTCLSELEDDAYGAGGPMSGQARPPRCTVHPNQNGKISRGAVNR